MGQSSSTNLTSLPDLALHCLRVAEGSPADGLVEPFFDYLIGVDEASSVPTGGVGAAGGAVSVPTPAELARILETNEGRTIGLVVYNAKTQRVRDVALTPSRAWSDQPNASLLGISVRVCNPAVALESVWHILEVLEGSPAEMAGLVPFGDWVCGWAGGPLHGEHAFYDLVEAHLDKPLRLYVYSADLDNLREVVVIPNEKWGGSGLLGCGVGYGILHRIPRPATPPATGSDEHFSSSARTSDAGRA
ncbi:uncharacterized protein EHS24_000536 [Apiotrichum porosum]|uniref:PDZ GRASP-type domain-containing protein n=1 Tax=Apiotrichum porosum TaxID=105984 RepID=A0A427YA81_9TREE|nr:uncharacterized protein EHS24_000536 [Apiotrichum porosum]RSH88012.1 hypothetical protein EHS24_000536 [Apiotrichum porosum]